MPNINSTTFNWNLEHSYTTLPSVFFSKVEPTAVSNPELVMFNESLAQTLGLNTSKFRDQENVNVFAGNEIPSNAFPIAQAYAGHQFGNFTMLGDGRAILLGEQITPSGERFDIQLKGAGPTPYSRRGDGRAALGPMLREYIISEAMHSLRIPTSRSLAVVKTGDFVQREIPLIGGILTRVSQSHLRVGTFEFAAQWGAKGDLIQLADYAIQRHFPYLDSSPNRFRLFLEEVVKLQASLIAKWQLVGFIHGVMNTDNMSISGETFDYGPCAFMDTFDPDTVFSSIDTHGRYAYKQQPYIAMWNLARLAESLLPLLAEDEKEAISFAEEAIADFSKHFETNWSKGMRKKLGLSNEEEEDADLVEKLLNIMYKTKADFTNTFRMFTLHTLNGTPLSQDPAWIEWNKQWEQRLKRQDATRVQVAETMKLHNPAVIPRNHRVEEALDAAVNDEDFSVLKKLIQITNKPFAYDDEQNEYANVPDPGTSPYRTFCGT